MCLICRQSGSIGMLESLRFMKVSWLSDGISGHVSEWLDCSFVVC